MLDLTTKLAQALAIVLRVVLGGLLVLMVLLNGANAFGRFVLKQSIIGADEILIFAMAWLVFLGAALVSWEGRHLAIDLIRPSLPPHIRRWLEAVQLLALVFVCVFVGIQSVGVIDQLGRIGLRSMAAQIPMTLPHAAVAVGLALAALFAVLRLVVGWRAPRAADPSAETREVGPS